MIVRIVGSLLTLALLLYVLKKQHLLSHEGWQQIITKVTNIPLWQLLLVFVMMMISRTAVGGRWHVLWRASGAEVSWWQSIRLTYAGLFASNFLPTTVGGDVVRLAGALRYHCDSGACVASLLLDRFVGLAGMVLTVPLALPAIFSGGIVGVAHQHSQLPGAMPLAAGLAGGWQGKIAKFLQRLWAALAQGMRHPRALLQALLFTGVHMVCFFTIMYLLLRGMGEHATYWQVTGSLVRGVLHHPHPHFHQRVWHPGSRHHLLFLSLRRCVTHRRGGAGLIDACPHHACQPARRPLPALLAPRCAQRRG